MNSVMLGAWNYQFGLSKSRYRPASQPVFINEDIYRINKLTTTDKALYTGFMLLISLFRRYIYGSFMLLISCCFGPSKTAPGYNYLVTCILYNSQGTYIYKIPPPTTSNDYLPLNRPLLQSGRRQASCHRWLTLSRDRRRLRPAGTERSKVPRAEEMSEEGSSRIQMLANLIGKSVADQANAGFLRIWKRSDLYRSIVNDEKMFDFVELMAQINDESM